jgi:hypothetical protein
MQKMTPPINRSNHKRTSKRQLQCNSAKGLELIPELANSRNIAQVNIVTLNHDTVVEQYLRQQGIHVVDGDLLGSTRRDPSDT